MKTTAKNVALTINSTTLVLNAKWLNGAKRSAAKARDNGIAVSLKWTDADETDLCSMHESSGSCEDCESCGTFTGRRWWVKTGWLDHGKEIWAWNCSTCLIASYVRCMMQS